VTTRKLTMLAIVPVAERVTGMDGALLSDTFVELTDTMWPVST